MDLEKEKELELRMAQNEGWERKEKKGPIIKRRLRGYKRPEGHGLSHNDCRRIIYFSRFFEDGGDGFCRGFLRLDEMLVEVDPWSFGSSATLYPSTRRMVLAEIQLFSYIRLNLLE